MFQVIASVWALLLGMTLIMIGNGMQATLMGVRGAIEGFGTLELSIITSGYFLGFLVGSRLAPGLIRRVGHVRVFAALGSFLSAGLIAFPVLTDPISWTVIRVVIGFCLSGVYVTAESWLNNAATNQTRGKVLSLYMVAQMAGLIAAQGMMNLGEAAGYFLFVIPSILVSLSFAPILLSVTPTPAFESTKPMSLRQLYDHSPLASVGILLLGGVFAAQFGMASVYGAAAGLSVAQITGFVAAIFAGSMVWQFPVGWLSDRMDRRLLILGMGAIGAVSTVIGLFAGIQFETLLVLAFIMGGVANPLYALFIAYTNDTLEVEDMAAASGGLIFAYGVGAIAGPIIMGQVMELVGPEGFWLFSAVIFVAITLYASWRMTRRAAVPVDETGSYLGVLPTSSPVAVEAAQEWYVEQAEDAAEAAEAGGAPADHSVRR
ncbi:MAG: MFS transporter [Pseudomonadota bacterium]|uniref:MFS transporter n=1 Tax=Roseovarius TaxID=74030 RepID=UPI0022A74C56|nr:MFS transporter [Roseovarius sp. EGI FJ00037]MCZ0811788.1 MFS transporter [Roseovarius sp. EGI FJ00037]